MSATVEAYVRGTDAVRSLAERSAALSTGSTVRVDRWVIIVVIAVAVVLAIGLATAWWIACQNKGMYPALDMPNWNSGGTWKAYCKK